MELRDIRYFVVVAEQQSFTRAAAILQIAQPSLSQQIRKLERELNVELFHRTKRSVSLTPAARAILPEARVLLSQAKLTADIARLAASGDVGELRIGFIESVVFTGLPALISEFEVRHPSASLRLIQMSSDQQISALRAHALDVGLMRTPIQHDDIEAQPFLKDPIVVALPQRHRLAKSKQIPLRHLRDEKMILYSAPHAQRLRNEIVNLCHQAGFIPNIVQEAGEFHTICGLVAAGLGISFVPLSARAINVRGLAYRMLTAPHFDMEYCVAHLRNNRSPAVAAFCSMLSG